MAYLIDISLTDTLYANNKIQKAFHVGKAISGKKLCTAADINS